MTTIEVIINSEWADKLTRFSAHDQDPQRINGRLRELAEKTVRDELGDVKVDVRFYDGIFGRASFSTGCRRTNDLLQAIFKARYDWLDDLEWSIREENE